MISGTIEIRDIVRNLTVFHILASIIAQIWHDGIVSGSGGSSAKFQFLHQIIEIVSLFMMEIQSILKIFHFDYDVWTPLTASAIIPKETEFKKLLFIMKIRCLSF